MTDVTITPQMRATAMAEALRELNRHSRLPFRKLLAELLGAAPTGEQMQAFAAAHPDKWASAVALFAGMSGYEKGLVELNVYNVAGLSDVELLRQLHAGEGELEKLGIRRAPVTIPAVAEVVECTHVWTVGAHAEPSRCQKCGLPAVTDTREAPAPAAQSAEEPSRGS